jgi:hypothetical protein
MNPTEKSKRKAYIKSDEMNLNLYAVDTAACNKALRRITRQSKPSGSVQE